MTARCPGCRLQIGAETPWCGPCGARTPEDMYRAERDARAAWERAVSRATAWLETHPRVRPQELQVIALIAGGLDTDRIARQMGISPHTVREYIRDVSSRWQVRGRPQLVGRAYELGYLRIEPVGRLS